MIRIETEPDAGRFALGVHQWGQLLQDWSPVWTAIREVYDRHQVRHFATEGASTGARWPGQSAPTVPIVPGPGGGPYDAWKARMAPGQPVLVFSGRLREAATGGAGSLRQQDSRGMEMGVDGSVVPYAGDHHFGRTVASALFRRDIKLKRRPVIRFAGSVLGDKSVFTGGGATFGQAIRQLVQAHVVRARREAFGHDTAAADATIARIGRTDTR